MRMIVRDKTITGCQKIVDTKAKEGWKPVNGMKPKLDDSQISWGDISYVCVLERENNFTQEEARKKRRWNHNGLDGYNN